MKKNLHILLVEDNEGDIILTKDAFDDAKINNKLSVVRDGKEAIDFLTKKAEYQHVNLPDLLLLDINLPKKNGIEVLKFIKENDALKHIPVIMLTTSSSETDINLAYKNFANCYITKPIEVSEFMPLIAKIQDFWVNIVTLPDSE